jgi:uncharacterized oligopeptide transporter (OPT) family protein
VRARKGQLQMDDKDEKTDHILEMGNSEAKSALAPRSKIRKDGLKNLGFAIAWFILFLILYTSGLLGDLQRLCLWPESALERTGAFSGRSMSIVRLVGFLGLAVFLGLTLGWILLVPSSMFMILTGRRSRALEQIYPIFFHNSRYQRV